MPDLKSLSGAAYLRELERKSRDSIMVYNPTDKDFPVMWEGMTEWIIPAKDRDAGSGPGRLIVPRYIAEKYAQEMAVQQINEEANKWREENRAKYSPSEWIKMEENFAPRTNNPQLLEKYMRPLIVGIVKEYGYAAGTPVPESKVPSGNPVTQDIFDQLIETATPANLPVKEDYVSSKSKKFVEKIS
jgi:hypothetical protein